MPVLGQLACQPPCSRFRADKTNSRYSQLRRFRLAARRSRTASRWLVPVGAVTWVKGRTTMPGLRSIRSTRYRDIEASSASRRMIRCTVAQERLRNRAACPAELPPPTMATGMLPQAWASA